jgi:cobalt-zinc-cadmium efflux system outer membrane protein
MLQALEQQLQAEVREQRLTLAARRRIAERYRSSVIPAHEKIVEVGQRYNNYMLIGVFELLAARQAEFGVDESYLGAVRDYWLARVDLQRALGGRPISGPLPDGLVVLPEIEPAASPMPAHRHGGEPAPAGGQAPPSVDVTPMQPHMHRDDDAAPPAIESPPDGTHEHH